MSFWQMFLFCLVLLVAVMAAVFTFVHDSEASPLLIRSIYWTHYDAICAEGRPPADVAAALDSLWPADCYVMGLGQYEWFEPVVAALQSDGKHILRYVRPTTLQLGQEDDGRASFDRQLHDAFVAPGYVLKDETGEPLRYRWYAGPYILRWDLISELEIDDLVSRLAYATGAMWELDEFYHSLRPWMLERRDEFDQGRLDLLYDRQTYRARRIYFYDILLANTGGTQQGRPMLLNGDSLYWYGLGYPVFFENAPAKEFDEMFPKWRAREGCVIEVRTPVLAPGFTPEQVDSFLLKWNRIHQTIKAWLEDGETRDSWLWCDNEAGLYEAEMTRPATWAAITQRWAWEVGR